MSIVNEDVSQQAAMRRSKNIAALAGPAAMALSITEAFNLDIWRTNVVPVTYLNGTLLLVAGLAIVRFHNRWTRAWPVLVTLAGWVLMLSGLWRMSYPNAQQAPENLVTYAGLALGFTLASFMTFKAYGQEIWMMLSRSDAQSKPETS